MNQAKEYIHKWHDVLESDDLQRLDEILAETVIFSSPVVFKPLEGKQITMMYLHAAGSHLIWKSLNIQKRSMTA
jgi:hypothetical protein